MCGLAGIFETASGRRAERSAAERMAAALTHRGPDSAGSFADGPCALAFRRLSIIDLQTGEQPLSNEDGSLVLVCNGEIYDHAALRRELEARGHRFRSRSDAEVLIHLYEEHGEGLFERFDGQFAFALFDRRRGAVLLARDRFGVCPLFWWASATGAGGTVLFASEIKALLRHPAAPRRVDLTGLDAVLCFPGLAGPHTLFEGIHSLESGHAMWVDRDGVRRFRYWDLDYPLCSEPEDDLPEDEHTARLEALLDRAVERRLQADVPVGVYLSGGLDSSLVAALAARHAPGLASFSITFDDPGMDESRWQREVARACGLTHHEIRFDVGDIAARMAEMMRFAECPVKETYNVCSLALAEAARESGVRVVLGGEGADELFAGYAGYKMDRFRRERPAGSDSMLEAALEAELNERLWGAELRYEKDLHAHRTLRKELYSPGVRARFAAFDCTRRPLLDADQVRGRDPIHQRSYLDVKLRLADHLLGDHGDRMAMARGVEPRFPFLDRDVVEHARTMRPQLKLDGYQEKYILHRIAARHLPRAVIEREKFGFHAPGSPALLQAGVPWVEQLLSPARIARDGVWDPEAIAYLARRNAQPGFRLDLPFEEDVLLVVITFNLLLDEMNLPGLS